MKNKDLELLKELEEDTDIIDHTFKKPVDFEGEVYEKIVCNLEGLTGKDIRDVSAELIAQGEVMGLAETNKNFLATLAARSANLPREFMDYIPASDFSKITIDVQNFLLG